MCICEELSTCIYRDLGRQLIFHLNPCLAEVGLGRQTLPRRDARIVALVELLLQFVKLVRTEGGTVATELGLFAAVPTACTLVVLAVNICRQQSTLETSRLYDVWLLYAIVLLQLVKTAVATELGPCPTNTVVTNMGFTTFAHCLHCRRSSRQNNTVENKIQIYCRIRHSRWGLITRLLLKFPLNVLSMLWENSYFERSILMLNVFNGS